MKKPGTTGWQIFRRVENHLEDDALCSVAGLTTWDTSAIIFCHTPYFGEICHAMLGIPADGGIGWPPREERGDETLQPR